MIHLEGQWQENILTVQGRLMHERVHDREQWDYLNGVITVRSLPVRSLMLGQYGLADVVEFIPTDMGGVYLKEYTGMFSPKPVEYKRGRSKVDDCDRVQLCAQALCLEEMLQCHIDQAEIFYGETRRREKLFLNNALRMKTINLCNQMINLYTTGHTPAPEKSPSCQRCSLQQVCQPTASSRSVAYYWANVMKGLMDEP